MKGSSIKASLWTALPLQLKSGSSRARTDHRSGFGFTGRGGEGQPPLALSVPHQPCLNQQVKGECGPYSSSGVRFPARMTVSRPPAIRGLGGEIPHLSSHKHGPAPALHAPWETPEVAATCCRVDGP